MYTVTGAWSRVPATDGCVSVTVTWIVALLAVPDATVPTEEIFPGVLAPSGSVTVTASPTATSVSWAVLSGIVTTCWSEVAASTGPAAGPPRLPSTLVTRIAAGSNTTDPSGSDPGGLETPSADSICCTPYAVVPREVIPAQRADIRAARIAQRHQVMIELGHIRPGQPLIQRPPGRHRPVQQHHRDARCPPGTAPAPDRSPAPADGSQVSVPPPGPRTVYESAYPKVAVTGTCDDRSSRTTGCVAGGGAPGPVPDESRDRNAPAAHAIPAPAPSTTSTSTTATARRRRRAAVPGRSPGRHGTVALAGLPATGNGPRS